MLYKQLKNLIIIILKQWMKIHMILVWIKFQIEIIFIKFKMNQVNNDDWKYNFVIILMILIKIVQYYYKLYFQLSLFTWFILNLMNMISILNFIHTNIIIRFFSCLKNIRFWCYLMHIMLSVCNCGIGGNPRMVFIFFIFYFICFLFYLIT